MKESLFLFIVAFAWAGAPLNDEAQDRTGRTFNKVQQFIQQEQPAPAPPAPAPMPAPRPLPEKIEAPVPLPIPQIQRHHVPDNSINYKELAFQLLIDEMNETKQRINGLEETVNKVSKVLELQAEVNNLQKAKQQNVKFWVNLILYVLGALGLIGGGKVGIDKFRKGRQ